MCSLFNAPETRGLLTKERHLLALHRANVLGAISIFGGRHDGVPLGEDGVLVVHHGGHAVHVILKSQVVLGIGKLGVDCRLRKEIGNKHQSPDNNEVTTHEGHFLA